jgi:hypothetical protein
MARSTEFGVTNQDQSKLEFTFSNEQLNAPVAAESFCLPRASRSRDRIRGN